MTEATAHSNCACMSGQAQRCQFETGQANRVAHLFFSVFGLCSGLGAEAIHLLSQPLTDASHLHGGQLLQIIKEQLGASALAHLLGQHLTHKVRHRVQNRVVAAQNDTRQKNKLGIGSSSDPKDQSGKCDWQ